MTLTKQTKLVLALVLQLAIIFIIIAFKTTILMTGTKIVLRMQPVDPKDFLRGDYVHFDYEINRLDLNKLTVRKDEDFKTGNKIYVELAKSDNYFLPTKINRTKPDSNYFIKGVIAGPVYNNILFVQYGIEDYFMPEGKARSLENLTRGRRNIEILMEVSVGRSGDGLISKIIIGGEKIDAADLKEVVSRSNISYQFEQQKDERNNKRQRDIQAIIDAMEHCYHDAKCGNGIQKYLSSATAPKSIDIDGDPQIMAEVPVDPLTGDSYEWINNIDAEYGYCVYALLEGGGYIKGYSPAQFRPVRNSDSVSSTFPTTLEQCGVVKPQAPAAETRAAEEVKPIASIEGNVFIDANKNKTFDKNDIPYSQAIAQLVSYKAITETTGKEFIIASVSVEKGHYKLNVPVAGSYRINIQPIAGSGIGGIEPSGACWQNFRPERIFNGGEQLKDCNWIVYFD